MTVETENIFNPQSIKSVFITDVVINKNTQKTTGQLITFFQMIKSLGRISHTSYKQLVQFSDFSKATLFGFQQISQIFYLLIKLG